ncbi:MAG: hypothetical protein HYU66_28375 [Armatimonadetes bacterium]|nr:hypothetical protein [Armatimonadota bacterium]
MQTNLTTQQQQLAEALRSCDIDRARQLCATVTPAEATCALVSILDDGAVAAGDRVEDALRDEALRQSDARRAVDREQRLEFERVLSIEHEFESAWEDPEEAWDEDTDSAAAIVREFRGRDTEAETQAAMDADERDFREMVVNARQQHYPLLALLLLGEVGEATAVQPVVEYVTRCYYHDHALGISNAGTMALLAIHGRHAEVVSAGLVAAAEESAEWPSLEMLAALRTPSAAAALISLCARGRIYSSTLSELLEVVGPPAIPALVDAWAEVHGGIQQGPACNSSDGMHVD